MSRAAAAVALAVLVVVARGGVARADDEVRPRTMAFVERGGAVVVSTTFAELFDDDAIAAVGSGLPATVVVRVFVYRRVDEVPVSLAVAQHDVVYDVWDDVYVVRSTDAAGVRLARHPTRVAAIAAVTRLRELPLAAVGRLPVGVHHVTALIAELNPVSDALQAEMRGWLTQRAGDRLDASASFFGSFVSVFVNPRLAAADRVVRLRSQPWFRIGRAAAAR